MKVAVIGGGSTYTPELVKGLAERDGCLLLTELWLMDLSAERLEVVGRFAQRIAEARGARFRVRLTTDRREAVRGARYVISQLRVGGMKARREDEYLGRRHGLIGQETTGIGGIAKALRTVPVVLQVAAEMRELAPGALLINFSNPAGVVTEALARHAPDVPSVGLCNVAITTKMEMLARLPGGEAIDPGRAELDTLGLNHLTWHRGLRVNGQEMWPQILGGFLAELRAEADPEWDPATIEALGMIPNPYVQYYYHTGRKLAAQEKWPPSRAEEVMVVEAELLAEYAQAGRSEPPAGLMKRGGAYYSTAATQLLNAHHNDLGETHVVNVPHRGAVAGWPAGWVVEMPCRVDAKGIHPLPAEPLPPACFGLVAQVKMHEILTVAAAINGDRRAAYQALLAHPLGPAADRVGVVLDDLLETNREHLPRFWEQ